MATFVQSVEVDVDVDISDFDDDEVLDRAVAILPRLDGDNADHYRPKLLSALAQRPDTLASDMLNTFAALDATRLEKAIQAIRDQSEHDLQMAIGG